MSGVRSPQHPPRLAAQVSPGRTSQSFQRGAVVQLVRIPACHAGGRGFESRPLRHFFKPKVTPTACCRPYATRSRASSATLFLGAIARRVRLLGHRLQDRARSSFAAKVDGEHIPTETVRRAWQQRQSQLQQMLRDELPPDMVKSQQARAARSVRAADAAQAARGALRLSRQRRGAGAARHGISAVPGRRQVLAGSLQRAAALERPDRAAVRSRAAERPADRPAAERSGRVRVRRALRARSPLCDGEAGARDRLRADPGERFRGAAPRSPTSRCRSGTTRTRTSTCRRRRSTCSTSS